MTPPSKTTHVPLEDLAAYAAGDLSGAASAAVMRHVNRCDLCQADLRAIETTMSELDAVPELAIPLRAAVVLKRAIAQERGLVVSTPAAPPTPAVPPASAAPPTPAPPVRPAPPVQPTPPTVAPPETPPTVVAPAAAAPPVAPPPVQPPVVPPPSTPVAPPGPAAPTPLNPMMRPPTIERPEITELSAGADMSLEKRRKSKLPALVAVAATLVVGAGAAGLYLQLTKDDGGGSTLAARAPEPKTFTSGAQYSPENVRTFVPGLLTGQAPPAAEAAKDSAAGVTTMQASPGDTSEFGPTIEALKTPEKLRQCLDSLTAEPGLPAIAIDYAHFQDPTGQHTGPALIVVLAFKDDPNQVDVFVVGPRCSRSDADLYYFERVSRS